MDTAFLADSSRSMEPADFARTLDFIVQLATVATTQSTEPRIGVIKYAAEAVVELTLNDSSAGLQMSTNSLVRAPSCSLFCGSCVMVVWYFRVSVRLLMYVTSRDVCAFATHDVHSVRLLERLTPSPRRITGGGCTFAALFP